MSSAGGGAAVTAAGSALGGLVLRLQCCSQAGRGSAFRPAHGQEEEGALGSVTGSEARDGDSCARGLRRGRGQVAQGWAGVCAPSSAWRSFPGAPGPPLQRPPAAPRVTNTVCGGVLSDVGRAPGKHPPWREAL